MSKNKQKRGGLQTGPRGAGTARPGRPAPPRPRREFPWLPVSVAAVFAVILIGLFGYLKFSAAPVAAITCDAGEQTAVHYHAHLTILNAGEQAPVPANIGIQPTCFYWLHTHDESGVIHIEAPADQASRTFTLGDFFDVWHQPLDATHVSSITLQPNQKLVVFVNGKPYPHDPRSVPLKAHALVTLEITPPQVPPPGYHFPQGL